MIVDSLRYWVEAMHVDGFRFDLASILTRDASGLPLPSPPVLWDIESDPVLAGTKLIAEAWDAAGLYQVGSFIGDSWKEWNGRFRDDVRDFFRGAPGSVGRIADRLVGSPAIYGHEEREAEQSVNFVTCHDGFTLNDLVSYNRKHNEANGEANRRLGHRLHRAVLPALLGSIGVARPSGLDPSQVPGTVRLAANPAGLLGAAHRRLAHPDVPGERPITLRAHPYNRRPVKS
jgi:pullulanase/glycogen debranching enzyme